MVALKWVGISTIIIGVLFVSVSVLLFITGMLSAQKIQTLNVEATTQFISPTATVQHIPLQPNSTPPPPKVVTVSEPTTPEIITDHNSPDLQSDQSTRTETEPATPEIITGRNSPDLQSDKSNRTETELVPKDETTPIVSLVSDNVGSFYSLITGYGSESFSKHFHPADWGNSRWYKVDHLRNLNVTENQTSTIQLDQLTANDFSGLATRIRIPTLDVDAPVNQLRIIEIEGIKQYESPKNVVGRVPTDSNLHESITGWYFGHLESPIKSEGNVFHKLPEIASFLSNGDPVYIHLNNHEKEYVYQAYKSEVVHEKELKLYDAGLENIVLVTCFNRPYYDYRQLVSARLVDIR